MLGGLCFILVVTATAFDRGLLNNQLKHEKLELFNDIRSISLSKDSRQAIGVTSTKSSVVFMLFNCFKPDMEWPYLFVGSVLDLFSDVPAVQFIGYKSNGNCDEELEEIIPLLPPASVVVHWYGYAFFSPQVPLALVHLQDEQPWTTTLTSTCSQGAITVASQNECQQDHRELQEISYKAFNFVLRSYYDEFSDQYLDNVVHIPVPVPLLGYVLGNQSNEVFVGSQSRYASRRQHLCMFSGRTLYPINLTHALSRDREQMLMDRSNRCVYQISDGSTPEEMKHLLTYEEYIEQLGNSVFVLCPAGVNPETFRLYEALEMGAIPLFVQPPENISFANVGLWSQYPGPILESWDELDQVLEFSAQFHQPGPNPQTAKGAFQHVSNKLDMLQSSVREWYGRFKKISKEGVRNLMDQLRIDVHDRGYE